MHEADYSSCPIHCCAYGTVSLLYVPSVSLWPSYMASHYWECPPPNSSRQTHISFVACTSCTACNCTGVLVEKSAITAPCWAMEFLVYVLKHVIHSLPSICDGWSQVTATLNRITSWFQSYKGSDLMVTILLFNWIQWFQPILFFSVSQESSHSTGT